ncbi:hypothetical protein yc1106_03278 [Curvularia clavata]|uniref:Uncharacterized protein n=1 Tax=Curvularia clavata TaxID=95742 RepID=A0A9Q8Z4U1_CURCL|nr:hypothetical protein yc1106_03278 [Curvularia clavata]
MIFSRGCTDATGKDVACPQQCRGVSNIATNTNTFPAWQLQTCNSGEYCCRAANSTESCCNDPTAPQITTLLNATLQVPSPVPTATQTPKQESPSPNSSPSTSALPVCNKQNNHTAAVVGGTLGGILGGIILGLALTVRYMYKRERRQRRLKEHYETQMSKTNAYRKALESSAGSARPSLSVDETKSDSSD